MAVLGIPDNFQSSDSSSYTIVFEGSGAWVDADGHNCELVSINAFGETRWAVHPDTATDSDHEAVGFFGLSPFRDSGKIERRGDHDRRNGEQREGERRLRNRDGADRRMDEQRRSERRENA